MERIAAGATHRGRVRVQNQDALLLRPDLGLFAVADGLGGHAAGEVASTLAIQTLEQVIGSHVHAVSGQGMLDLLTRAARTANHVIHQRSLANAAEAGMGTTLTAVLFEHDGNRWYAVHVGDSRLLRVRGGTIQQLTTDHTILQESLDETGSSTHMPYHPAAHLLSRALGVSAQAEVDTKQEELRKDDLLLLCSDGLTNMLTEHQILWLLRPALSLEELCRRLLQSANEAGGTDNITAILIRAVGPAGARKEQERLPTQRSA